MNGTNVKRGVRCPVGWIVLPMLALLVGSGSAAAEDILTSNEDRQVFLERIAAGLLAAAAEAGLTPMDAGGQGAHDVTRWTRGGRLDLRCCKGGSSATASTGSVPAWRCEALKSRTQVVHEWSRLGDRPWGNPSSVFFGLQLEHAGRGRWGAWQEEAAAYPGDTRQGRAWTGFQPKRLTFPLAQAPRGFYIDLVATRTDWSFTRRMRYRAFPVADLDGEMVTTYLDGRWPGEATASYQIRVVPEHVGSVGSGECIEHIRARVIDRTPAYEAALTVSYARPSQCYARHELSEDDVIGLLGTFLALYRGARPQEPGIVGLETFDANPLFTGGRLVVDIEDAAELVRVATEMREGVCADAASRLLLRVETEAPGFVQVRVAAGDDAPIDDGTVDMLFGGRTQAVGEKTYAFALYKPPTSFRAPRAGTPAPEPSSQRTTWTGDRLGRVVAVRDVALDVGFGPQADSAARGGTPFSLRLVRPPVVLVHGTFDNPKSCWETAPIEEPRDPKYGALSMRLALAQAGFFTSLVDFQETNGSTRGDPEKSTFAHNYRVLWANPGGIYDALSVYREKLDVAATQVDVVGHSLGGLIGRLWASDGYRTAQPTDEALFDRMRTHGYRRLDNLGHGDIHRLVTLCTPHMGSDLGHFAHVLRQAPKEWWQKLTLLAKVEDAAFYLAELFGYAVTPVVKDQFPHLEDMPNSALQRIGATNVPAHAVVCWARAPDFGDFGGSYGFAGRVAASWLLNVRSGVVEEFLELRGQRHQVDRLFGELMTIDGRLYDPAVDQPAGWLTDGTYELRIRDKAVLMAILRAAIFGNTQSDMVVRVESQAGGLPLQYTTQIPGILHSFAPRYREVQQTVVSLLDGPATRFSTKGFPAPAFLRNVEPYEVAQDPSARAAFIAESGLVPSHAEAISFVAQEQDVVILARPVNHNSTPLIQAHNATKDMHVKGKSSNWGPQKGYIPVEQRFSKIHFERDPGKRATEVQTYDGEVQKCLSSGRARSIPLVMAVGGVACEVHVVEGVTDPELAIVLKDSATGTWHGWKNGPLATFDAAAPPAPLELTAADLERSSTRPFLILADRISGKPLTADYDMLAFATRTQPAEPEFDPEMGSISAFQAALVQKINNEVRVRANYLGGNVTHHGPENQFPKSPGADFPITVFQPDGYILTIKKGREGRHDYWLKRYLHHLKSRDWFVEPNPYTWNWGPYDPVAWPGIGYRPDDRKKKVADDGSNCFDSDEGDEPRSNLPVPVEGGAR